ncbi:MAG: VOC family protein [Wenzhouxiangella sp.]|nr:VOC family protein [Wenzhouxiangella sp.]
MRSLSRTLRFYHEVLGIEIEAEESEHGPFAMKQVGTVCLIFFEQPDAPPPGRSPVLVFSLESGIQDAVTALARHGVEIVTPLSEAPGGLSTDFLAPDGHVLSLYQAVTPSPD